MDDQSRQIRHAVGVMTGTSIDGIDAAVVRLEGVGLCLRATHVRHISRKLGDLAVPLRLAAEQNPMPSGDFARLAWKFGEFHAAVIDDLLRGSQVTPDLICVHGQTIFHQPPLSWQLVNPAPIAQRLGCPVVSDLRQADLAAGGQGAPITPIADWIWFRSERKCRAIVNLGGFCNVTILPKHSASRRDQAAGGAELRGIRGFDVCACNQVLDAVARESLRTPFDKDGEHARRGRAKPQAADALLAILERQRAGGRSLGTGDEAMQWLNSSLELKLSPADLAASAVDAIARTISAAICEHQPDEIILGGGGARNLALVERIAHASQMAVRLTDDLGVPIDARESMAFGVLGALCADGVPITLPQVTGCRNPAPVAGVWCGLGASTARLPAGGI